MNKIFYIVFIIFLLFSSNAFSQAPSEEVQNLNNVGAINSRVITEGYILFGLVRLESGQNVSELEAEEFATELYNQGIRGIVSFTLLDSNVINALDNIGIRLFARDMSEYNIDQRGSYLNYWNFHDFKGWSSSWHAPLLTWLTNFEPSEIAIHCSQGVDRTGNATAFILSTVHGWKIQDALYAVAGNDQDTLDGIADVLLEFGIHDHRTENDNGVSIYTYRQRTGMHADSHGFRNYIRRTIEMSLELGGNF